MGSGTTGFGPLADWVQETSERNVYMYWDITPDRVDSRVLQTGLGYEQVVNARYVTYKEILYTYMTRWVGLFYEPEPISEKDVYLYHCTIVPSERNIYFYLDEQMRYMYVHGLLTQTPLLLKYPKYYNWDKIPKILTPEFQIWSYYDLDYNSITIQVVSDGGFNRVYSLNTDPNKLTITKLTNNIYKVRLLIDHVFNDNEEVTVYICCFDVMGNYLKPGMW